MKKSVYSQQGLMQLIRSGRIEALQGFVNLPSGKGVAGDVGPASIDIGIIDEVYRVQDVILIDQRKNESVRSLLTMMGARRVSIGSVMEYGVSYLAKANININLSPGTYGYFNGKSTSGRCFLNVRAVVDKVPMFDAADRSPVGCSGEVWLIMEPMAFPIILSDKVRYNQLRVFTYDSRFSTEDLQDLMKTEDLVRHPVTDVPFPQDEMAYYTHKGSVLCTVYAKDGLIGFTARQTNKPLDMEARGLDPHEYWEPFYAIQLIKGDPASWVARLNPMQCTLMTTYPSLHVPKYCSAELVGIDRRFAEAFTHIAGYFDPGWLGTGTLEVYAPGRVTLRHDQPFARFEFEGMQDAEVVGSSSYAETGAYQNQLGTKLPKQFEMPPEWQMQMSD